MEEIYLVYAEAVPTKAAINSDGIVEADAIIFVAAKSQERAKILARSALMNYGYRLTKVLEIFVSTPSVVSNLDPQAIAQYLEAVDRGYGVVIIAHAPDPAHPLEVRSWGTPILNEIKKH